MRITDILRDKGAHVVTIAPDDPVPVLLERLAEHKVGALVVSSDGGQTVAGIVSERDVVRHLRSDGDAVLGMQVKDLMTAAVHTSGPDASVDDLMATMTEHRIRHIPVVDAGKLVGIVSIGDVVKFRMDELQQERDQLTAYIHS